jgi:hypothetical protein
LLKNQSTTGCKAILTKAKDQLIQMTSSKILLMQCQGQMPDGKQQNPVTKSVLAYATEHYTMLTDMPFKHTTRRKVIRNSKHQKRCLSQKLSKILNNNRYLFKHLKKKKDRMLCKTTKYLMLHLI